MMERGRPSIVDKRVQEYRIRQEAALKADAGRAAVSAVEMQSPSLLEAQQFRDGVKPTGAPPSTPLSQVASPDQSVRFD